MKKAILIALIAMAASIVLSQSQAFAGKKNDTVVLADVTKLETLDVLFAPHPAVVNLSKYYMDSLLWRKPGTRELLPCLASSWKWVDDKTMEFDLKKGVLFHNGEEFNADDVVYSLNWMKDPANKVQIPMRVNWIEAVIKIDPYRVRIVCKKPHPIAPNQLLGLHIMPKEYHSTVGAKGFQVKPVGTGPYKVESFSPGGKLVLVKNANYFKDSPKGQPKIGTIVYKPLPELQTQIAEIMTGDVDWIWNVPSDQAEQLKKMPNVIVETRQTLRFIFMLMDAAGRTGENPFQNKKVREAVNYTINKQAICDNLLPGAQPLKAFCNPAQFGCFTDVFQYEYDPAMSKKLLAEAGYPDGFEVSLEVISKDLAPVIEAIIDDLNAVGIKARLTWLAPQTYIKNRREGKQAFSVVDWGSGGIMDVDLTNQIFFTGGGYDYSRDEQLTELTKVAGSTIDPEKRKEYYKSFFRNLSEEAYVVPLFVKPTNYVYNNELDLFTGDLEWPAFYRAGWK